MDNQVSFMEALEIVTRSIKAWTNNNISLAIPKYTNISLLAANWIGEASPYHQDIDLSCVTETSMVNLQPSQTQLAAWKDAGLAFTTYSNNGYVRIYAIGGLPIEDYTVQVTVQEVIEV